MRIQTKLDELAFPKSTRLNKSFFSKNEPAKEKRVFRRKNRPAMMDQINSQGWKIRRDEEKSNRTPCETRFVLRKNNNCLIFSAEKRIKKNLLGTLAGFPTRINGCFHNHLKPRGR